MAVVATTTNLDVVAVPVVPSRNDTVVSSSNSSSTLNIKGLQLITTMIPNNMPPNSMEVASRANLFQTLDSSTTSTTAKSSEISSEHL